MLQRILSAFGAQRSATTSSDMLARHSDGQEFERALWDNARVLDLGVTELGPVTVRVLASSVRAACQQAGFEPDDPVDPAARATAAVVAFALTVPAAAELVRGGRSLDTGDVIAAVLRVLWADLPLEQRQDAWATGHAFFAEHLEGSAPESAAIQEAGRAGIVEILNTNADSPESLADAARSIREIAGF